MNLGILKIYNTSSLIIYFNHILKINLIDLTNIPHIIYCRFVSIIEKNIMYAMEYIIKINLREYNLYIS